MDDLDSKLESILGNPQIMEQIINIAGQVGGNANAPSQDSKQTEQTASAPAPIIDSGGLRNLSNLLGNTSIDKNQQALIRALSPYVGAQKTGKLERAMQAAKMAQMASGFLTQRQFGRMGGG